MRKLLFILIIASLGHDIYSYCQEPEKGFSLSDLGLLWSKCHKESHDQWKIKVREFSQDVEELVPENNHDNNVPEESTTSETTKPAYAEGFIQTTEADGSTKEELYKPEENRDAFTQKTTTTIKVIGLILEQKAVLVFGSIAAFFFLLNLIFSFLSGKRRRGSYKYSKK